MSAATIAELFQLAFICTVMVVGLAPTVTASGIWIGQSPNCVSNPNTCHMFDLEYLESSASGDGRACFRGEKVLCRPKKLDTQFKDSPINDLIVVAYNVKESRFATEHNGQTERTCHIPRALLNKIPDVDVIVFTEVFIGGCLQSDQANQKLSLAGLFQWYGFAHSTEIMGENSRSFYNTNGGVQIVSKWPITEEKEFTFTKYASFDSFIQKGVIYGKVNKHGAIYNVLGTQLQTGADQDVVRTEQAAEIHAFIGELDIPRTEPVIVAGDFNCDYKSSNFNRLLEAMGAAMPTTLGDLRGNVDYSLNEMVDPAHTAKEWLDYVVSSKQHAAPSRASLEILELKSDNDIQYCSSAKMQPYYVAPTAMLCGSAKKTKDLSDHFPVVGKFTFN